MKEYQAVLSEELKKRKDKNPSYSLRAFARDLDLAPSRLSEILNKKQGLSISCADKVAEKLFFNTDKKKWFIALVEAKNSKKENQKQIAFQKIIQQTRLMERKVIDREIEVLTNWYSFAIRRLTLLHDFQGTPHWISNRLNITIKEATQSLEALTHAGHFSQKKNGEYIINNNLMTDVSGKSKDPHFKKIYKEIFQKAYDSRFSTPAKYRDNAIHVFAINKDKLNQIKEMIRSLEDDLDNETYKTHRPDTIYCLTTHLFPLSELNP